MLAAAPLRFERQPEVHIPVGTPGIDHAGEIFRTDGVVALPLAALRDERHDRARPMCWTASSARLNAGGAA